MFVISGCKSSARSTTKALVTVDWHAHDWSRFIGWFSCVWLTLVHYSRLRTVVFFGDNRICNARIRNSRLSFDQNLLCHPRITVRCDNQCKCLINRPTILITRWNVTIFLEDFAIFLAVNETHCKIFQKYCFHHFI